jgi:hypothetical protein
MTISDGLQQLSDLCRDKDWFFDLEPADFDRIVVYVNYMSLETLTTIPDESCGHKILVHYAASKLADRSKYIDSLVPITDPSPSYSEVEMDVSELDDKITKLRLMCNANTLEDIFHEIHDGPNAVTKLSMLYPEAAEIMDDIYHKYGFDLVYDLLVDE